MKCEICGKELVYRKSAKGYVCKDNECERYWRGNLSDHVVMVLEEKLEQEQGSWFPVVYVRKRKDFPSGWEFDCKYCGEVHRHGVGLGHRGAHCSNHNSPFFKKGYILKLKKMM